MGIVAVAGDASTTTSVALASAWPVRDETVLIEADPAGGDLAAWLDMPVSPSLSTLVTQVRDGGWDRIADHCRHAGSGLQVIPAPARAGESAQAVGESARHLVNALAATRSPITIADAGALAPSPASHPFVALAATTVIVHRQATQSSPAAAVRLQRLADQVDAFANLPTTPIVAVIGAAPFAVDEIESFLAGSVSAVPVVGLPVDELSAAVLAGRPGVSARRLARLPLMKAAADLAGLVERTLGQPAGWPAASWTAPR